MLRWGKKMKCVIGLGNPGRKYERTRHNIGFMVIDELLRRYRISCDKKKFNCEYTITHIAGEKLLLVKPQTFMNLSGEGVQPLLQYYNVTPENTLVAYDDLDLPLGKIRLREKGGHGGHNGIRSLITHFSTKEFKRLRIGIGRPIDQTSIVNYVLQRFSKAEMEELVHVIAKCADASNMWLTHRFVDVMNEYNQ